MPSLRRHSRRLHYGKVTLYQHHGAWWLYYRENGEVVRRKAALDQASAERLAAQISLRLSAGAPSALEFSPISTSRLRLNFLEHHENVLGSSYATVRRYQAATRHLENFAKGLKDPLVHTLSISEFIAYLRRLDVSPNGHPHTAKRRLRLKGIQFILETCRSLFSFGMKRRHFPPYAKNPFLEVPIKRLQGDDPKAIFVFDQQTEQQFFQTSEPWSFPIFFVLAKTGLRVGEMLHLLIEDIDLKEGWLKVVNKQELGWRIKTGRERAVPIIPEVVGILQHVIGSRTKGVVFLRPRFLNQAPLLDGLNRAQLVKELLKRQEMSSMPLSRAAFLRLARAVWRDAGAIKAEALRNAFSKITGRIGQPEATCPKSWRHTFATLLQEANVDPLIRQLVLGHAPTENQGLGMTSRYTHPRAETIKRQITQALMLWPASLQCAGAFLQGGKSWN